MLPRAFARRGYAGAVTPAARYYRSVEGRWSGPLDLRVTSWRALLRETTGLSNRLRLLSFALARPLLGAFRLRLDTSVDCAGPDPVHTTRVSTWGLPLLLTREVIEIGPDGRSGHLRVEVRAAPLYLRTPLPPAPVVVDEDAAGASYAFHFLGAELRQRARRSDDGGTVTLSQETPAWRGEQVLRRVHTP